MSMFYAAKVVRTWRRACQSGRGLGQMLSSPDRTDDQTKADLKRLQRAIEELAESLPPEAFD